MEAILDNAGETLIEKLISMAVDGHLGALRLCIERLLPRRRDAGVQLDLPATDTAHGISAALSAVVAAIAAGLIAPSEGEQLARILAVQAQMLGVQVKMAQAAVDVSKFDLTKKWW